jgi:hypothetical protein
MSDRPLTESADAENQKQSAAEDTSSSTKSVPSPRRPEASRWPTYATLAIAVIAVIAVTLAALAYFHPAHNGATGIAQQGGDAKANVCSAYAAAHKAVIINTHLQSQNPDVQLAIAANARLALLGGGSYLQERLAANTAAPADLANAAKTLADTIQQLGINYLNDAAPDVQNALRKDLDNQITQINKLCA